METKKIKLLIFLIFLFTNMIYSYNEVSTSFHELDASVNDVIWCGTNKEYILLLTELNSVYRSEDHGFSWKKLNDILLHTGKEELEEHESEVKIIYKINIKIGKVSKMLVSPVDKNLMVFLGTHGVNWLSSDCGKNVKALNHGRKIQEYIFHPTEREWGLASAYSLCEDYVDEPCTINKEIYITKDLGHEWTVLASYGIQFGW